MAVELESVASVVFKRLVKTFVIKKNFQIEMIPGKMDGYSEFLHIVTETVNHQQNFLNKKKLVHRYNSLSEDL